MHLSIKINLTRFQSSKLFMNFRNILEFPSIFYLTRIKINHLQCFTSTKKIYKGFHYYQVYFSINILFRNLKIVLQFSLFFLFISSVAEGFGLNINMSV